MPPPPEPEAEPEADPDAVRAGMAIVARALEEPLRQIVANAGIESGVVVESVRGLDQPHHGYNVVTGVYEDFFAAGVVDPAKVTRLALQNAASIAGMFLTTEVVVADKPETQSGAGWADSSTT
jgi:chaperonin GroEL